MLPSLAHLSLLPLLSTFGRAAPTTEPNQYHSISKRWQYQKYFDLQGHRGGRGQTIENTLPSFAHGLISGVTSLEMDLGLTSDGHLVVWHDENFVATKCRDTQPAFKDDPDFPYVGRYLANLTLAQVQTLDCGSLRQTDFPLQLTVPGTQLSTLDEMFDFVACATDDPVLFNIETKVDGDFHNLTRSPEDFVDEFVRVITARGDDLVDRVTHQSFDWRALIHSKKVYPTLRTSALCDDTTLYKPLTPKAPGNLSMHGEGPSNWLASIDVDSFNGSTVQERVAQAAASIDADFLSPVATAYASNVTDIGMPGFIPFTTPAMVKMAHSLGLQVKPWTPNRLNLISSLVEMGVDGLITDFPEAVRGWAQQQGLPVAPRADEIRVATCLAQHLKLVPTA